MADNSTKIVLTAQDNASPVLAKAAGNMLSLGQAAEMVKGQIGAIGAGLTVAGFGALVADTVKAAAALHDMSQQTGATVEALSGIAPVAKLSDTSMEQVGAGLQKLSKHMLEAQTGSKDQAAYFKALGVSITDTSGQLRDSGAVFQDVAKQIAAIQSPTERVAAAQLAFGKSGAQLLPLMHDLAAAGDLVVKTTSAQAALADNIGDNWTRLGVVYQGVGKTIAIEMLPALDTFVETALEVAKETGGIRGAIKELAEDGTLKSWGDNAAMVVAHLVDLFQGLAGNVTIAGKAIGAAAAMAANPGGASAIWQEFLKDFDKNFKPELFSERLALKLADPWRGWTAQQKKYAEDAAKLMAAYADKPLEAQQAAMKALSGTYFTPASGLGFSDALGREKNADTQKQAYDALIKSIKEKIAVEDLAAQSQDKLTAGEQMRAKVLADIASGALEVSAAEKGTIKAYFDELITKEKLNDAERQRIKLIEESWKAEAKRQEELVKQTDSLAEQLKRAQEENAEIGLTTDQLNALKLARMDDAIAIKQQQLAAAEKNSTSAAEIELLQEQLDTLRQLRSVTESSQIKQTAAKALEDQAKAWENFARDIEQSLTDALMRSFEAGQGFGEAFRNNLVNMFKTMVLKVAVQAIVSPVMDGLKSASGLTSAASTASSGLNIGSNLLQNGISSMGFGAAQAGINTAAYTSFGSMGVEQAAMLAAQDSVFGMAGTAATLEAAGASMASTIATAVPYIGAALAIGSMLGAFSDEELPPEYKFSQWKQGSNAEKDARFEADKPWMRESAFGRMSVFAQHVGGDESGKSAKLAQQYLDPLVGLDNIVASYLDKAKVSDIQQSLDGYYSGELASPKGLTGQFEARLGVITDEIGGFVDKIFDKFDASLQDGYALVIELLQAQGNRAWETLAADLADNTDATAGSVAALLGNLRAVNAVFDTLSETLLGITEAGATAASGLLEAFGGLANFQTLTSQYFDAFYTEEEKAGAMARSMASAFDQLGVAMPDSLESFRAAVENIDISTTAGQDLYAEMLKIAPAFAQMISATTTAATTAISKAKATADQNLRTAMKGVDVAFASVQRAIEAQRTAQTTALDAANEIVGKAQALRAGIDDTIDALRGAAVADPQVAIRQALADLDTMITATRSSGDLPNEAALAKIEATLRTGNESQYATRNDYRLAMAAQAAKLTELNDLISARERIAKSAAELAQDQIDILDDQLAAAQAMVDQLNGIDTSVLSVADAVAALQDALEIASAAQIAAYKAATTTVASQVPGYGGYAQGDYAATAARSSGSSISVNATSATVYLPSTDSRTGQTVTAARTITNTSTLDKIMSNYGMVKSYDIGTRYVPTDMLANIHQGEIIIDPASADILRRYGIGMNVGGGDAETAAEVAALRAELRAALGAVASNTRQSKDLLDSVVNGGNTLRTEVIA